MAMETVPLFSIGFLLFHVKRKDTISFGTQLYDPFAIFACDHRLYSLDKKTKVARHVPMTVFQHFSISKNECLQKIQHYCDCCDYYFDIGIV